MISLFSLLPPVQHLVPAVGRTKVNEPSIALESSPPDLFDDLVLDADHDGCELEAFEAVFDDLQEVIASR